LAQSVWARECGSGKKRKWEIGMRKWEKKGSRKSECGRRKERRWEAEKVRRWEAEKVRR